MSSWNIYRNVDCDGDGVPDHVCYDDAGNRGVILSVQTVTCMDTWPSVSASVCTPVFNRKCCSVYVCCVAEGSTKHLS